MRGEVVPGAIRDELEEDAVQDAALVDGRATTQGVRRRREEIGDEVPLLGGEGEIVVGERRLEEGEGVLSKKIFQVFFSGHMRRAVERKADG